MCRNKGDNNNNNIKQHQATSSNIKQHQATTSSILTSAVVHPNSDNVTCFQLAPPSPMPTGQLKRTQEEMAKATTKTQTSEV
jgi:hypothetical protein